MIRTKLSRLYWILNLALGLGLLVAPSAISANCSDILKTVNGSKLVVGVDLYSSAVDLIPLLTARGHRIVHVHSKPRGKGEPHWEAAHYANKHNLELLEADFHLNSHTDIPALAQKLRDDFDPDFLVTGAETGVFEGDHLAELLGVPNNGTRLSKARMNKFETHEALKQAGVRHIPQIKSDDLQDLITWANEQNYWPLVLKPVQDAGTTGVSFVYDVEQIEAAFHHVIGKVNSLGQINTEVTLQHYVGKDVLDARVTEQMGEEFAVDTVGWRHQHRFFEIIPYERDVIPGAATLYRANHLLPFEGKLQNDLVAYTEQVLNALDIQYGPAHLEIKLNHKGEPILIEMNARFVGANTTRLIEAATGHSQVTAMADLIDNPETFIQGPRGYEVKAAALDYFVSNRQPGQRYSREYINRIKDLPGVIGIYENFEEGEELPISRDADSLVLHVQIVDPDPVVVESTRLQIELWQHEGRFWKNPN